MRKACVPIKTPRPPVRFHHGGGGGLRLAKASVPPVMVVVDQDATGGQDATPTPSRAGSAPAAGRHPQLYE